MTGQSTKLARITTVGLDIAKNIFCAHAVDSAGQVVVTKVLRRSEVIRFFGFLPRCLIGIEACGSAHFWGRELSALGHDVRLIHPAYVKPYVQRQKNDAADAAAICEAVTRPRMSFVPIRTLENQAVLMHHKVRAKLVRQRTQLRNAMRGHLAEIGIITDLSCDELERKVGDADDCIPPSIQSALLPLVTQMRNLASAIREADREIARLAKADEVATRLMTIPGIGPLTASALVATVCDPRSFRGPRSLSAFLGLVPRERSSGGKTQLGKITKRGNRYLRGLLVIGAFSVLRNRGKSDDHLRSWSIKLRATKAHTLAAVAVANKLARIALAIMISGQPYRNASALSSARFAAS